MTRLNNVVLLGVVHFAFFLTAYFAAFKDSDTATTATSQRTVLFLFNQSSIHPGLAALPARIRLVGSELENVDDRPEIFRNVRLLVILLGFDEKKFTDTTALRRQFESLPREMPALWIGVPPVDERVKREVDNTRIGFINQRFREICADLENCSFIDITGSLVEPDGNLKSIYHDGSGIKLNRAGIQQLKTIMDDLIPKK